MTTLTCVETTPSISLLHYSLRTEISLAPPAIKMLIQYGLPTAFIGGVAGLIKKNYLNSATLALTQSVFWTYLSPKLLEKFIVKKTHPLKSYSLPATALLTGLSWVASLVISHYATRWLGKLDPTGAMQQEQKKHPLSIKQAAVMSLPYVVDFVAYAMWRNHQKVEAISTTKLALRFALEDLRKTYGQK